MLLGDRRGGKIHSAGGQTARSGVFFFCFFVFFFKKTERL